MTVTRDRVWTVPNALSAFRLVAAPAAAVAAAGGDRTWFVVLVCLCLASDILDGIIARKFDQASDLGARLDSFADELTFLAAFFGTVTLEWAAIRPDAIGLYVFVVFYVVATAVPLARFGKLPAFHLYSWRATGYLLGLFFVVCFTLGYNAFLFRLGMIVGCIGCLEVTLVAIVIREFRTNQRGLFWVLRDQMRGAP